MTVIDRVRVKVSDVLPDGTIRMFTQYWERALCNIQGDVVVNTHTGKTARLLDLNASVEK